MRYLLIGNYGVGNLGDEALKEYFLQKFPEVEWVVVCHGEPHVISSPTRDVMVRRAHHDIVRLPCGFRSFFFTPWWRTIRAYWGADGVVFGGGSLFTDSESWKAPMLWWWHAFFAWLFRKPFFLAFQGVGPFRTSIGEWCAKWVVRRARFVSVRDHKSFERVRKWRADIVESFDPIFISLSRSRQGLAPQGTLRVERGSEKIFVIIPRQNSDNDFFNRVQELYAQGLFSNIRILSLQPSNIEEQTICKTIERAFPKCTHVLVHGYRELLGEIHRASFVLSERYHGALAALALGIPFETIAQTQGDKLSTLVNISKEEALTLVEQGEKALRYALNV